VDGDDRAYSVFLTDKGDALLRQLIPHVQRRQRRLLQGENQQELEETLDRLRRRVEAMMREDEADD
jgi:DNA-binding MarR family transcriptional regulator